MWNFIIIVLIVTGTLIRHIENMPFSSYLSQYAFAITLHVTTITLLHTIKVESVRKHISLILFGYMFSIHYHNIHL